MVCFTINNYELTAFSQKCMGSVITNLRFESLVNELRCKTIDMSNSPLRPFESLVNELRCKTVPGL